MIDQKRGTEQPTTIGLRKGDAKAEISGGRRGSSSPHGFPSFFGGGRVGEGMAPICDKGFGPSTESVRLPRAQSESGIGGIDHSLDAAPEDLPRGNPKAVTPRVIPADDHEPDIKSNRDSQLSIESSVKGL
jgi:hypothetical protein